MIAELHEGISQDKGLRIMKFGSFAWRAAATLCGLLLFFLGSSLPFQTDLMAIVSLFAIILLTVGISYGNRTPIGGFFLGVFTSASFLLGFFLMTCIWELSSSHFYAIGPIGKEFGLSLLMGVLHSYGTGMLTAVSALASIGLFFGLLGYVVGHVSLQDSVARLSVFRDYWSSIHLLGKSERREYIYLDRRLSSWSIRKKEWWRRLVEKLTEPQPDLVFVSHRKKREPRKYSRGDLFDLSSGRMIVSDVIDPSELTSKYRPSVLKVAEVSSSPKGVRRLALERLLSRFLERIMPSRAIWALYLLLSASLVALVYIRSSEYPAVVSAVLASAVTLFFVWRWRRASKELLERRPDETVLIFIVYIILALLYGFYFEVIMNPPAIPEGWIGSWFIWTKWLLSLSGLLGLGYICIHRECEVVNTYFYDNRKPASGVSRISPFKEPHDEPFWLKEEKEKGYWVLRFMYFWRYEFATVPHSDWERVEVWVDAEKGTVKWVVSDYHYRELWYKVEGDLPLLYVKFFFNFHTPVPVVDIAEDELISSVFAQHNRNLIKIAATGKAPEIAERLDTYLEVISKIWENLHPMDWVRDYGLPSVAAGFCSKLPWTFWRYPQGLEKAEIYLTQPAVQPEDQPKQA
jgi:hypothetical protein